MSQQYDALCAQLLDALHTYERTTWAREGCFNRCFNLEITITWPKPKRHTGTKALITPGLWGTLVYQGYGLDGCDNRYRLWAPDLRLWLRERGLL